MLPSSYQMLLLDSRQEPNNMAKEIIEAWNYIIQNTYWLIKFFLAFKITSYGFSSPSSCGLPAADVAIHVILWYLLSAQQSLHPHQ